MLYFESKYLPPKGYWGMSAFGIVIKRKDTPPFTKTGFNHEEIHAHQQFETQTVASIIALILCAFFPSLWWLVAVLALHPILYGLFSVAAHIYFWKKEGWKNAIKNQRYYFQNPYEMEAFSNEKNFNYIQQRPSFICWTYFKKWKDVEIMCKNTQKTK